MKSPYCYAFVFLLLTFVRVAEAQPLCSYNAKISDADKKNSAGASLTTAGVNKASLAAVIRQDRANFHQFKVRDAEDEADCVFSDKQMRAKIESMINASSIDAKTIESIVTRNPIVTVAVYQDKLVITVADAGNAQSSNSGDGRQTDAQTAEAGSMDYTQTPNHKSGVCIGFISKEIDVKGVANVDGRYMKYLKTKNKLVTDVINTQKNHAQCFEGGVIISDCLQAKNVNSKIIGLMLGYNTGITNYKDAADRAIMSLACME